MGLRNWGLDKVTGWVGKKTEGYKTRAGGVGMFLLAVVGIIGKVFPDQGLPDQDWEMIFGEFSAGLIAFGVGNKVDRAHEAVKENTEITKSAADKIPWQFP